jgi:hypothetical protein
MKESTDMNSLLVEYRLFDSPKSSYITITKSDLAGEANVREIIAGSHLYPTDSVTILDLLPQ